MTDAPQPFVPPAIQMTILTIFAALGILALLCGFGYLLYHAGQSSVQPVPVPESAVTPEPTAAPAPTPTPSPYPTTVTIVVNAVSQPPDNMFPEVIDQSGKVYDISGTGIDPSGIILGGTYDVYITGTRQAYGGTIYTTGWITLVGQSEYYPNSAMWISDYNNRQVIYGPSVAEYSDSRYRHGNPNFVVR